MIQVRRAVATDFLQIAALDRAAWVDNREPDFIPDGEHVWRIWVEYALTFCAVEEARVVGAILAFPCTNGRYCLHKIFVEKAFRRMGVASCLSESLMAELDSLGVETFLTVDPANEKALILYRKWGFSKSQHVKGYYRDTEDRLLLTRPARDTGTVKN